jgi:hypothetical protein
MPLIGAFSVRTRGVSDPQKVIFLGSSHRRPRMVTCLADAFRWISTMKYPSGRPFIAEQLTQLLNIDLTKARSTFPCPDHAFYGRSLRVDSTFWQANADM